MIAPNGFRAALSAAFLRISRLPPVRYPALWVVRQFARQTFRLLRTCPTVADVYLRGSYARGDFSPFSSDIDLVLMLRGAAESLAGVEDAMAALGRARRRNPWIRDWWQHVVAEAEIPLIEAFWPLFGADGWRDERGQFPVACPGSRDPALQTASAWYQLCLWSGSVVHACLNPASGVHDLRSGLKKSRLFAARLGILTPGDSRAPVDPLIEVYRYIEKGAFKVAGGYSAPCRPGIVRTERAVFHILAPLADDYALASRMMEMRRGAATGTRVTYLLPSSAADVWPFPADPVLAGAFPDPMPRDMAREIYLHEALFLPSTLRLAVGQADSDRRLGDAVRSLERAAALYGRPLAADDPRGSEAAFRRGVDLCRRLRDGLLDFATERGRR